MARPLPGLALVLAACQGGQPEPPVEEVAVPVEQPQHRPVSSIWPEPTGEPDPFGTEGCPSRFEWDRGDPLPTACNPFRFPYGFMYALGTHDRYMDFGLEDSSQMNWPAYSDPLFLDRLTQEQKERLELIAARDRANSLPTVKTSRRYPARGCTADPPLLGLDLTVPGYDGQARVVCGERFVPVSGAALLLVSNAPTASKERIDELLRFAVQPGTERLFASLPRPDLVMPGGQDETTRFRHYALLAEGADVRIRGSGGSAKAADYNGYGDEFVDIHGDCGKVDIDLDPWASVGLQGTFSQFEIQVGWGVGYVDLFPGTRLEGTSRLHVGGAGRLELQTDVEVRIDYPGGWTVVCYQVDNPACGTWGPGSLYTVPGAEPVIDLAGPRGVVVLLANPWPDDLACPQPDGWNYHSNVSSLGLLKLVEGGTDPSCYDNREVWAKTLADSDVEPLPDADVTSWLKTPEVCALGLSPDQYDPVDRGPWPGPPRWGGPRQGE